VRGPAGPPTSSETDRQFILTLENDETTIFIGKEVPYLAAIRRYLVDEAYVDAQIEFVSVGTRLRATARIRGNLIEVQLTPEISYQALADERTGVVQVDKLSSTIVVRSGGTIEVGRVESASEFYDHFYRSERGTSLSSTSPSAF
jgi:hypothetical protein